MKNSVREKVQHILSQAKNSNMLADEVVSYTSRPVNDNLSKAIRTPHEAAVFMTELNALVKLSQTK